MGAGIEHTDVGGTLTQTEYHSTTAHFLGSGTSFPLAPTEKDLYYRTDLHIWHIYNGTSWDALHGAVPACVVRRSAALAVTSSPISTPGQYVDFDIEQLDTDTMHDNSTNPTRITFNTAGTYICTAAAKFAPNTVGYRQAVIRWNATYLIAEVVVPNNGASYSTNIAPIVAIRHMAAGDYIEMGVDQDSGGDLDLLGTTGELVPRFSAVWCGN